MAEADKPFREGFLWLPPQSVIGQIKKSWQKKFCRLYCASKQGIQRIETFDSDHEDSQSGPIFTLENCIKITQDTTHKHQPHIIKVVNKGSVFYFGCASEEERNDWASSFQSAAFNPIVFEQDNDLYCSANHDEEFDVVLVKSDASERNNLPPGEYRLILAATNLTLTTTASNVPLLTWPYRFIRRYGYSTGKFTFEAGRKCDSGEGTFILEHANEQEIFRSAKAKMKSFKKQLNINHPLGSSSCSSLASTMMSSIGVGLGELEQALGGMSARSRSPLLPSAPPLAIAPAPPTSTPNPLPPVFGRRPPPTAGVTAQYDRLQHLGSTTKLNVPPGYTAPIVRSLISSTKVSSQHSGYGIIRKKSTNDTNINNNIETRVVLKPHVV